MKYVYEQKNWPNFIWRHEIISPVLAEVRHHQGRLLGRIEALGFQLQEEAALQSITEETIQSSEIEGETLDREQVRSSVARHLGIEVAGMVDSGRIVDGVVEMALDATQRYAEPLTAARICNWHAALFPTGRSGMRSIAVGSWRTDEFGPTQVVSGPVGREDVHFEAPPAISVADHMNAFLDWFESELTIDPVLKAAIAHFWFVTVHPFDDGNGRIARAITDLALARSERSSYRFYSMSSSIRAERPDYYSILERSQKGTLDITDWLLWFLRCLQKSIDRAEITLAAVLRKAEFWKSHIGTSLNERQRLVINRLLDGFHGKLTSSKWAALTKTSQDTASRDIDDLMTRGILVRGPAGGRSTNYKLVLPGDKLGPGEASITNDADSSEPFRR